MNRQYPDRICRFAFLISLCLLPFVSGCTSSKPNNDHWLMGPLNPVFKEDFSDKTVQIDLADGTRHEGLDLRITPLTTEFNDSGFRVRMTLPTDTVWRLQVTNHGKGAAKGLGLGLLIGGGLGVLAGLADENPSMAVPVGAVLFGAAGAVIGAVAGGASGATSTYVVNPDLAWPTTPSAPDSTRERN